MLHTAVCIIASMIETNPVGQCANAAKHVMKDCMCKPKNTVTTSKHGNGTVKANRHNTPTALQKHRQGSNVRDLWLLKLLLSCV